MTDVVETQIIEIKKPIGGRAAANQNGREFEKNTSLAEYIAKRPDRYELRGDELFDRQSGEKLGQLFGKNKIYQHLKQQGVPCVLNKKLLPDDAILIGDTMHIMESKFQTVAGSVDEKLTTCDYKVYQYSRLLAPLGIDVRYYYILNHTWFEQVNAKGQLRYDDEFAYILDKGCDFYFNEFPLDSFLA